MKKFYYIFLPILLAVSCSDRVEIAKEVDPHVYFLNRGFQEIGVSGDSFSLEVDICRSGLAGGNPLVATVSVSPDDLTAYNETYGTSYDLLPENCYVMDTDQLSLTESGEARQVSILFRLTAFPFGKDCVLPLRLATPVEGVAVDDGATALLHLVEGAEPELETIEAEINGDKTVTLLGSYVYDGRWTPIRVGFFYAASEAGLVNASFTEVTPANGKLSLPLEDMPIVWYQTAALVGSKVYRGETRVVTTSAGFGDLSSEGWSNCYLVPMAGDYSFELKDPLGTPITGGTSVEWVWVTGKEQVLSDLRLDGDRIRFHSTGTPGNEVIALLNSKGTVLWSWHIWVTGAAEFSHDGVAMLDRNVGAHTDNAQEPGSVGFYYQWGRKDPFPGVRYISRSYASDAIYESGSFAQSGDRVYTEEYSVNSSVTGTTLFTNQAKEMTIDLSVANPTVYFGRYNAGGWAADNATIRDYWGGTARTKGRFDPCPQGYRIPALDEFIGFINGLIADGGRQSSVSGSWGQQIATDQGTFYVPAGRLRLWSGTVCQPGNPCAYFGSEIGDVEKKGSFWWNFSAVGSEWTCESTPVRCIKITQ